MGQLTFVILLLILHTSFGLAQNVTVHDGSTASYLPDSHMVTPSVALENGFTDTNSKLSDTQNVTNNPNNVLKTDSSTPQQNNSTIDSKLPNIAEIKKNSGNATDSSAAVSLTFTDIAGLLDKETTQSFSKSNSSNNDVINTEQIMPVGSSSLGSGPGPTKIDKNALYIRDSVTVSEGMETPTDANTTATNISVDNTDMLPKLKWEPGMKQPQTISDLVKITGADIKFITSQFGVEINGKSHDINMTDPSGNKSVINVSDEKSMATKNRKVSLVKDADSLTDTTIINEFGIAGIKMETTLTNLNELTPGITPSIIQDDWLHIINPIDFRSQKPQLTTINSNKEIPVSAPNVVQGIDNTKKSNIVEVKSMSPIDSKAANLFLPKRKFNTQEPVQTIVVEKEPENLTSPRLNNLNSRRATSHDALDLTRNAFQRNGERVTSETRQGNIPRGSVSQADMDSRRIISFGNNPQYTIGTGNAVQIPIFIARNGLPYTESTEGNNNGQTNQGLFRRRLSGPGISEMPSGTSRSTTGEGFTVGTRTPTFPRGAARPETRGLPSWAPIGSMDSVRSGIFRSSVPIQGDFSGSSSRNTISGGRVFDRGMSTRDSSGSSMPVRNEFRSASSGASFNYIPLSGELDNRVPMTGSIRDNSAMQFGVGDIIPREVRQSPDIVTRSGTSSDFSRQQFGGDIRGISVSRPNEITRTTGFRRDFLRARDFNDIIIPRAVSFRRPIPRDGSDFSVPIRDNTLTSGTFRSGGFGGSRTPMFTPGGMIDSRIRPTGLFRGSIYRPVDMFAPSPRYFVRAF